MEELIPIVKDKINSLIKKPNMSEKLLMKPPFRFLHDTITAVIQTTGFAEGLYSPEDMDSSTINEKAAKIAYLDKIFGVVGICHVSSNLALCFYLFFSFFILIGISSGSEISESCCRIRTRKYFTVFNFVGNICSKS
jgi:hypothetical protein